MNGYVSEQEITFWLKQCLKSPAKDILYDGCSDLNVIWLRLETRFGSHLLFQNYSVSLLARKRHKNESLIKLADDIRHISDIVYYDLQQNQKERLAIMHFINALQSPAIQYDLTEKSPKTLDEALHFASVREMFFGVESQWGIKGSSRQQNQSYSIESSNIISGNHTQNLSSNQWPADVNPTSQWSQPIYNTPQPLHYNASQLVYNRSPQAYYYNVPQPIPNVPQSGQWNGPPHTSESKRGAVPQSVMNSGPLCSSHFYNSAAAPHIGSTNVQGTHFDNQYQQHRGMGNFQPISQ